jgi:formamidopyrimidine-DNA glycosylase
MLDVPEVLTISAQLSDAITGKTVESFGRGNSPHKFAFLKPSAEECERVIGGKKIGGVSGDAKSIFISLEPGYVLRINEMAGRLLFHEKGAKLPPKYQWLMRFADGTALTATVGLWAFFGLTKARELGKPPYRAAGISPIGAELSYGRFSQLFSEYDKPDKNSIKAFLINRPRINGFGNAYMQDMLFHAGIHPTRKVADVTAKERRKLYDSMRKVLNQAIKLGGSDDERDLYGNPGRYKRILSGKTQHSPCPRCGGKIGKIQFLGGATYFCEECQK